MMILLKLWSWWSGYKTTVLRIAVPVLSAAALLNLAHKFHRAVWVGSDDLGTFYQQVQGWFAGRPIYSELERVDYPPASYVMLWPFLGWPSLPMAQLLWALTVLAMLLCLSYLVVRESGADTPMERAFVALLPLSMDAAGFTLGNGQLTAHVLAVLLAGLLLLNRPQLTWRDDAWISILMVAALVKPSISVPFFWLVLFVRSNLRPALLVGAGYAALTLIAVSFQQFSLSTLFGWVGWGVTEVSKGYGHVSLLLWSLGLQAWVLPTSLFILLALCLWVYRHRHGDLWLLLSVTALVARFWVYHMGYDDLLILLPMVALFRIAKHSSPEPGTRGVVAGVLLAITVVIMLVPNKLHQLAKVDRLPPPLNWPLTWSHAVVWMLILIFLVYVAQCELHERQAAQE